MRAIRWCVVVAVVGLAAWALPLEGAGGATTTVHIAGIAYSPRVLTVSVGDTVTWVNDDPIDHSVTANDGSFDSSPSCPGTCIAPGASYTHTFTTAGTFAYHCRIHGLAMSGTVIVQPAPTTTVASTTPSTPTSSPVTGPGTSTVPTVGGTGSTGTTTATTVPGTPTPAASPAGAVHAPAALTG